MKEPKTDEELKQIALDIYSGKIFSDRDCPDEHSVRTVFMPLALMDNEQLQELVNDKAAFIYEYLDKAGPMACNGMPMFLSFKYLAEDDLEKVISYYDKITAAVEGIE